MIQNRVLSVQGGRPAMEDAAWVDGQTRMVVCDGMGGEEAGDLASAAVLDLARVADFESIKADAAQAIASVTHLKAGTTCTVAVLNGQTLRWLHTGDSALRLVNGEDMHAVYWSLVPASPVPVQSFERARRDSDPFLVSTPVRPKPTPRYRCPKCEATANTPKRCRACNVKMTSRKR